jgi:O-antigen ligase
VTASASRRPRAGTPGEARQAADDHASPLWWATVICLCALLAAVALAYSPSLVGKYYVPRFALLYPLTLAVVLLTVVQRRRLAETPSIDILDVLALGFAAWQALSAAVSPAPVIAWFGYYNRGTGALFWVALALLFVAARRLLDRHRGRQALTWSVAVVLVVAGVIAVAQVAGSSGLWGGAVVNGRVAGPTGNPVTLAGLSLLGLWLAAGVGSWPRWSVTQLVALAGVAGGATCLVLTVSRAAYLGIAVGIAVVAAAWIVERRRRALLVLACACAVALLATLAYGLAGGGDVSLLSRLDGSRAGGLSRSDSLRVALWREGVAGVAWRPLTGAGPGAFVVVDRLYRSPQDRVRQPWALASDPHSLPLLVAAGSGVPGLLLAVAFAALLVWTSWSRRRLAGGGQGSARAPSAELGLAGLSYLAATAVFLLLSPLDPTVAIPATLVAAVTCGAPTGAGRLSWRPPERIWRTSATAFIVIAAMVVGAALVVAVVAGVQWYRADQAFAASARVESATGMAQAAALWSWEPFYALEAGGKTWRQGLATKDAAAVVRGRTLVQQGVGRDPTGALGYADLARLDIAQGRLAQAVAELRAGLRRNPHHPALQGLWGYAALVAETEQKNDALSGELLAGLRRLPADTPDAWYWISRTLAARGDAAGAAAARARAKDLAPALGSWRYEQRLLSGR